MLWRPLDGIRALMWGQQFLVRFRGWNKKPNEEKDDGGNCKNEKRI